jgi:hypothetical protein
VHSVGQRRWVVVYTIEATTGICILRQRDSCGGRNSDLADARSPGCGRLDVLLSTAV